MRVPLYDGSDVWLIILNAQLAVFLDHDQAIGAGPLAAALDALGLPTNTIVLSIVAGGTPHRIVRSVEVDGGDRTGSPLPILQLVAHFS